MLPIDGTRPEPQQGERPTHIPPVAFGCFGSLGPTGLARQALSSLLPAREPQRRMIVQVDPPPQPTYTIVTVNPITNEK